MDLQNRRHFLQVFGAGAVGVIVDGHARALSAKAPPVERESLEELRSKLLAGRDRIKSLRLRCTVDVIGGAGTTEDSSWLVAGESLFCYSQGRHRLEHYRDGFDVIEISTGGRYLQHIISAGQDRALRKGPVTSSRQPATTLGRFLPVPRNVPAYELGLNSIDGEPVRVIAQGDVHFFVPTHERAVAQLDVFSTATTLRERTRFSRFESTLEGVDFPTLVSSVRFDSEGGIAKKIELTVQDLEVNPDLPESLFDIEGVTNHG